MSNYDFEMTDECRYWRQRMLVASKIFHFWKKKWTERAGNGHFAQAKPL